MKPRFEYSNKIKILEDAYQHISDIQSRGIIDASTKAELDFTLDIIDETQQLIYEEETEPYFKKFSRKDEVEKFWNCSWRLYGQNINGTYKNIFPTTQQVKGCFCEGGIEKLKFQLHNIQAPRKNQGGYWGWLNYKKHRADGVEKLESIWRSKDATILCLKNTDYETLEFEGEGLLVRLKVTSLGEIKPPKPKKDPELNIATTLKVIPAKTIKPKPLRRIEWDD